MVKPKPGRPRKYVRAPKVEEQFVEDENGITKQKAKLVTRTQAAHILGVSVVTVKHMIQRGDLDAQQDENGVWYLDESEVTTLVGRKDTDSQGVLELSVEIIKQSQGQEAKIFELNNKAVGTLLKSYERQIEMLSDRCMQQERQINMMIDTVEKARTSEHERRMEEKAFDIKEKRKEQVFGLASRLLPLLTKSGTFFKDSSNEENGTSTSIIKEEDVDPKLMERLKTLDASACMMIAEIEEERFQTLCQVSKPHEVMLMKEIREVVEKIKSAANMGDKNNEGSTN